ncbi:DUF2800 domain-containing protein [Corynebacterium stationis]|uniref:DUF2800 domain-containing protein n=2 Tax=Corynebacterium stationis TaxID=1705 RepID=A0AB36CM45_9CORY|nr:DUF2800 domain-containing protein [Corynebacterium stationis]
MEGEQAVEPTPLHKPKPAPTPEPVSEPEPAAATATAHKERAHALLSASGSARWLNCTPSPLLEEQYPDNDSEAAAEGTAAHELAEYKLRVLKGSKFQQRPTSKWDSEEMESHTDDYADHVMATLAHAQETSPAATLLIEHRLDFSHLVPEGFGTGDAIIIADDTMTIIDLKYGKGVEVSAEANPQMRLYALGALHQFGMIYDILKVKMVIFQPRLRNTSIDEIDAQALIEWGDTVVKPTAQKAMAGEGDLNPGSWCQFCKHSVKCPAVAKQYFDVIPMAQQQPAAPDPQTLSNEQIANIVKWSGDLKKWLGKVEKFALDQANNGVSYPGLKLVEGRSNRKYIDEEQAAITVEELFGKDPWKPREILGVTAMTKLLGKKDFEEHLGEYLHKPEGKPTLVPESDKRQALQPKTADTFFRPLEGKEPA